MVFKKRERGFDERLEGLGREIIRVSSLSETQAEAVVSSPFLYSRVRSRIAAELTRRDEKESWLSMLIVFWRAVPALALVAVFCLVVFLFVNPTVTSTGGFGEDAILSAPDGGIERAVFAENQTLSSDEVLATILNKDDAEASK